MGLGWAAAVAVGLILLIRPLSMAHDAGVQAKRALLSRGEGVYTSLNERFSAKLAPPFDPSEAGSDEVFKWLAAEPLVIAVMQRPVGRLWVRQGTRLVPSEGAARDPRFDLLAKLAEFSGRDIVTATQPPWDQRGGVGCSVSKGWITLWEWRPGSPEVEALLQQVGLGSESDFVAGFKTAEQAARARMWRTQPNEPSNPWNLEQAHIRLIFDSPIFPDRWTFWIVPKPEIEGRVNRVYARALAWGWVQSLAILGAIWAGLWFRRAHARQDALDADRMANMTHSLKTPLAVLKLRCDTLRLGRASEEEARHELSQMGMEVDRLSGIIDQALKCFRGQGAESEAEAISPSWFRRFTDELQPVFQSESRTLLVDLAEGAVSAPLPALRSALLTTLENALKHGAGTVRLETKVIGRQFRIRISDEGPGLDKETMRRLGQPFLRVRKPGQEGFEHEGSGLGLHLLVQCAQQEGWGLEMESEAGSGVAVILKMHALAPTEGGFGDDANSGC